MMRFNGKRLTPALVIIDMQNGFCSKDGSYDKLGMNITNYRKIIPIIQKVIDVCREYDIPIFYTQAVREVSGIDLLTRRHKILPSKREERIKRVPICIRDTWDAEIIDELKPSNKDHIVIKRRDSAFQDTELDLWLRSLKVDTLLLCGIDTAVCVDSTIRDAFNRDYDVIIISDASASMNEKYHYDVMNIIREWYGVVIDSNELAKMLEI